VREQKKEKGSFRAKTTPTPLKERLKSLETPHPSLRNLHPSRLLWKISTLPTKAKSGKSERRERQKGKQVREKSGFNRTITSIERKDFSCRGKEKCWRRKCKEESNCCWTLRETYFLQIFVFYNCLSWIGFITKYYCGQQSTKTGLEILTRKVS